MRVLGSRLTQTDLQAIVAYYDAKNGMNEMAYEDLLYDIGRGEPTIVEFTGADDDKVGLRFENVTDDWEATPETVTKFLDAFRDYIAKRMRVVGGTPQEHVHPLFVKYDKEIKGGLTAEQLVIGTRQLLKLQMSDYQAKEIIKFYDRKLKGFMEPNLFVSDLCSGLISMLHFSELSARQIASQKREIANNPFTIQPHTTKPNKILERFKVETLKVLDAKVYNIGGSKRGWMREAFRFWDPRDVGALSHYTHLQGAVKRLGLTLQDEDAHCLMKEYDVNNNGTLDYNMLIKDVVSSDPHFLEDATTIDSSPHGMSTAVTSRAPKPAARSVARFKTAAEAYARKSQGRIEPRDVLYGTFLRFDPRQCGRINENGLRSVCKELGVQLKEHDLQTFVTWFDTNGSDTLDYNELVRQIYGEDVLTRPLKLPPLQSPIREARSKIMAIQKVASPIELGVGSSTISEFAYGNGSEIRAARKLTRSPPISSQGNAASLSDGFGLGMNTLARNLQDIEKQAVKEARKAARQAQILEEKMAIQSRLESIDRQRNEILLEQRQHQIQKHKARQASQVQGK